LQKILIFADVNPNPLHSSRESSPDPFLDVEVNAALTPSSSSTPLHNNSATPALVSMKKKRAVRGRMGHGLKTMKNMREGEERSLQKDVGVVEDLLMKERIRQEQKGKKAKVLNDLVGGEDKGKEKKDGKGKKGGVKSAKGAGGGVSYFTEGMPTGRAGGSSRSLNEDFVESMARVTKTKAASARPSSASTKPSSASTRPTSASSGSNSATSTSSQRPTMPTTPTTHTTPVPSTPANQTSAKLEGGWEEVKMEDGRVYYYHRLTRASRWDKPKGAMAEAMEQRIIEEERKKENAIRERKKLREEEKRKAREMEEEKDDLSRSTAEAVKKWATGKGVHLLLNDLGNIFEGAPVPAAPLTAESSASEVKRAYMKAIRHVHPDKIGANASVQMKLTSQAVFGALNAAHERRKRVEGK